MEHAERHVDLGQDLRPLVLTWAALMALLVLSAGSALLPLGWINTAIGLAVALVKAALVGVIFMRLRRAHSLLRITSLIGVGAMVLLFGLSSADYFTRPQLPADYQQPTVVAPTVGSRDGLERIGPEEEGSTRSAQSGR
jgi:cytochrome c oxidase subunit 4